MKKGLCLVVLVPVSLEKLVPSDGATAIISRAFIDPKTGELPLPR